MRFVLLLSFVALLGGCCTGGIDEMTLRLSPGPQYDSIECRRALIAWNGTTEATTGDAVEAIGNGAGSGDREDWVQLFDGSGARVPLVVDTQSGHACQHGCPGRKSWFLLNLEPGTYTLVHMLDNGETTDDDQLATYRDQQALVTTLVLEEPASEP